MITHKTNSLIESTALTWAFLKLQRWLRCGWLLVLLLTLLPLTLLAADLTIDDGVVVKFGIDAQLVVRSRLTAGKGVILTSHKDDNALGKLGLTPQTPDLGDWLGLRLEKSAADFGALTFNDLTIRYGGAAINGKPTAALAVRGWSPNLQNLLITDNNIGLRVNDGAAPAITGTSFLRNNIGIEANNNSGLNITQSQLTGNSSLAIDNKTPGTVVTALNNWWGHPSGPKEPVGNPGGQGDTITTGVNFGNFKSALTLYNPNVRLAEPATYYEQHDVVLDLSCVNATEYRIAEGNSFANATPMPLTDNRGQVTFTASEGDGIKQINVEFRGPDNTTVVTALTGGVLIDTQDPSVTISNPANGSLISQPITVTATATDAAGISKVQLFLDG
jgi:large repetitive protein